MGALASSCKLVLSYLDHLGTSSGSIDNGEVEGGVVGSAARRSWCRGRDLSGDTLSADSGRKGGSSNDDLSEHLEMRGLMG